MKRKGFVPYDPSRAATESLSRQLRGTAARACSSQRAGQRILRACYHAHTSGRRELLRGARLTSGRYSLLTTSAAAAWTMPASVGEMTTCVPLASTMSLGIPSAERDVILLAITNAAVYVPSTDG